MGGGGYPRSEAGFDQAWNQAWRSNGEAELGEAFLQDGELVLELELFGGLHDDSGVHAEGCFVGFAGVTAITLPVGGQGGGVGDVEEGERGVELGQDKIDADSIGLFAEAGEGAHS